MSTPDEPKAEKFPESATRKLVEKLFANINPEALPISGEKLLTYITPSAGQLEELIGRYEPHLLSFGDHDTANPNIDLFHNVIELIFHSEDTLLPDTIPEVMLRAIKIYFFMIRTTQNPDTAMISVRRSIIRDVLTSMVLGEIPIPTHIFLQLDSSDRQFIDEKKQIEEADRRSAESQLIDKILGENLLELLHNVILNEHPGIHPRFLESQAATRLETLKTGPYIPSPLIQRIINNPEDFTIIIDEMIVAILEPEKLADLETKERQTSPLKFEELTDLIQILLDDGIKSALDPKNKP